MIGKLQRPSWATTRSHLDAAIVADLKLVQKGPAAMPSLLFLGLLPTEWVNLDVFLQVEADFKGFLVNQMVMSSQACCAHAKIRQEETSAG